MNYLHLAITIGILVAFIVDYLLAAHADWRLMLGLAIVPSIALIIGMLAMPESPRFLFKQGRAVEARALYLGCAGIFVALCSLAAAFAFRGLGPALGPAALASLMLYVGCFAFSLGTIIFVATKVPETKQKLLENISVQV